MKALAAVVREAKGDFIIEEVDVDDPHPDEVLVRIVASGICHTDIAVKNQDIAIPLPMVLGHEGSGVIEKVGSAVTHLKVGDHVVLSGDSCGHCHSCLEAKTAYCDEFIGRNLMGLRGDGTSPLNQHGQPLRGRFVGQSSFATYSLTPARSVNKIDSDLPLELMGPLGCGLTTGAGTVLNALKPPSGSSVAVFGCGTVGLSAIMGARLAGCAKIIAIDVRRSRLDMAAELGATHCIDASAQNPVSEIRKITGRGADFSAECSGVPVAVRQAVDCLARPAGAPRSAPRPAASRSRSAWTISASAAASRAW